MRDYHTVQMSKKVRKVCYLSRREELQDPKLLNVLTFWCDYYIDAWRMITAVATPDASYTLE